jgi:catechol 2,3-dioxygenase-like lactoylglutathione lyase family enzyme
MTQHIAQFSVVVRDYDEALSFYVDKLGFERLEDTDLGGGKRWVRVRPAGSTGAKTDQFWRDYGDLIARGVTFVRPPTKEAYGTVAVFEDLYGNRFDLIERSAGT